MMYINFLYSLAIAATTFNSQIVTYILPGENEPLKVDRFYDTFVLDTNSGNDFVEADIGVNVNDSFRAEVGIMRGNLGYWSQNITGDQTSLRDALNLVGKNDYYYNLNNNITSFTANFIGYYDNIRNTMLFIGLGAGVAQIQTALSYKSVENLKNSNISGTALNSNIILFQTTNTVGAFQGFVGVQFQMTPQMSLVIRFAAMSIPNFGQTGISPYIGSRSSKSSSTTNTGPFDHFDIYGISLNYALATAGIRIGL